MRKKQILARALKPVGVLAAIQGFRSLVLGQLPIINYHRVLDIDVAEEFPFDQRLISASCSQFDEQMKYIASNYSTIDFSMLAEHVSGRTQLPPKPVMITIDDGFDDSYSNVFPILKKYKLHATMFIATDYIGAKQTLWYDYVAFIIKNTTSAEIELAAAGYKARLPGRAAARLSILDRLVEHLKSVSNQRRLDALEELAERYGDIYASCDASVKRMSATCSWAQIEEMADHGIEIGSHTRTHPVLSSLGPDELRDELVTSKIDIEAKTGREACAIAYPNGSESDYNEEVMRACEDVGYKFAVAFHRGTNNTSKLNRFRLNRLSIEPTADHYMMPFSLAFPNL